MAAIVCILFIKIKHKRCIFCNRGIHFMEQILLEHTVSKLAAHTTNNSDIKSGSNLNLNVLDTMLYFYALPPTDISFSACEFPVHRVLSCIQCKYIECYRVGYCSQYNIGTITISWPEWVASQLWMKLCMPQKTRYRYGNPQLQRLQLWRLGIDQ